MKIIVCISIGTKQKIKMNKFFTFMTSPGPAFQESTGSCHVSVPALLKAVSSICDVDRWFDCIHYRIEIVGGSCLPDHNLEEKADGL